MDILQKGIQKLSIQKRCLLVRIRIRETTTFARRRRNVDGLRHLGKRASKALIIRVSNMLLLSNRGLGDDRAIFRGRS